MLNENKLDLVNDLPFAFEFIEDYDGESSYICSYGHHAFMDGLSVLSSFNRLRVKRHEAQDLKKDLNYYMYFILGYLLMPIILLRFHLYLQMIPF